MWWLQCCFWKSQRLSGLWSCCHLPWELCLTGVTFPGILCSGCLAPSPSWSSRLHLAETRWFLVLPHWPYWLPVYLPSSCVFLSYCSMSFLWSWCRFSRLLYSWIVSSWPWQMETECFHPQGSSLFFFSFQFFSDFWPRWRSRKPSFSTLQHWWDRGKEHLKSLAVRHCSGAHNERSLSRSVLSALACHLKGRIEYFGPSPYYNLTWFYNWPIHWRAFFRPQFYQFLTLR